MSSAVLAVSAALLLVVAGAVAGPQHELQGRREGTGVVQRREDFGKVAPDYIESRSSLSELPALVEQDNVKEVGTDADHLMGGRLEHFDFDALMARDRLYNKLSHGGPPPAAGVGTDAAAGAGTGAVKEVSPEMRSKVYRETETYEKVVMEAERQAGLPDSVRTTMPPEDIDETEEDAQEIRIDACLIISLFICIFAMVWSHRQQELAKKMHEQVLLAEAEAELARTMEHEVGMRDLTTYSRAPWEESAAVAAPAS